MMKDINRIKVVLVEKKRTSKWLSEQLGKDPATISKWCTNTSQPDLVTLTKEHLYWMLMFVSLSIKQKVIPLMIENH